MVLGLNDLNVRNYFYLYGQIHTVRLGYSKSIFWIIYLSRDYTNKLYLQMIFIWQNMVLCLLPTWYLHFEWRLNNYDVLSHILFEQPQYIAHINIEKKNTPKNKVCSKIFIYWNNLLRVQAFLQLDRIALVTIYLEFLSRISVMFEQYHNIVEGWIR